MRLADLEKDALPLYEEPDNHHFSIEAARIEADGYCVWPRLRETVEFCRRMGYQHIGVAFCVGLRAEAKVICSYFRKAGLRVSSVACKTGGFDKARIGVPEKGKLHPGEYESMCNPIGQALLLNQEKTEFNILVGLCVGHDSMFLKHSDALCTALIVKDRALCHNPVAAVYCAEGYCAGRLALE